MTTQDTLILAQTIILFLTGAVVVWYTIETARIRRGTSRQADLLAQQLAMLRAQVEREHARDERTQLQLEGEAQPVFRYSGGVQDFTRSTFDFFHAGTAPIRDLSVTMHDYTATVSPTAVVAPGDKLTVLVQQLPRPTPPFTFDLEYTGMLGLRRRRCFTHAGADNGEIRDFALPV